MGTLPPPGDVRYQVADLIARCVTLREAIADGSYAYAAAVAERLEHDLVALRERLEADEAA
jgi:hypothetical protein